VPPNDHVWNTHAPGWAVTGPAETARTADPHEQGVADGYAGGPYNEDLFADDEHGAAYRAGLQEGRTAAVDEELRAHAQAGGQQPRSVEAFMDAWADASSAAEAEGRETELFATVIGAEQAGNSQDRAEQGIDRSAGQADADRDNGHDDADGM